MVRRSRAACPSCSLFNPYPPFFRIRDMHPIYESFVAQYVYIHHLSPFSFIWLIGLSLGFLKSIVLWTKPSCSFIADTEIVAYCWWACKLEGLHQMSIHECALSSTVLHVRSGDQELSSLPCTLSRYECICSVWLLPYRLVHLFLMDACYLICLF